MVPVANYPDSTKTSLTQRLTARARERWPDLASIAVRHHGTFSYVDGALADGTTLHLCRLRYIGSAHDWRFAIYRASHQDYDQSFFPTGLPVAPAKTPSTSPAGSTWPTPQPGPNPRRTYGRDH